MKLSWEVDGVDVTIKKLEDGFEAGMEKAVDQILDVLEREAKDTIRVHDRIFNKEVLNAFEDYSGNASIESGHSGRLVNAARHAGAVEHGVHPSKYAGGGPPVEALMPWVIRKMKGWRIGGDRDGGGSSIKEPIPGDGESENDLDDTDYEADWERFNPNGVNPDELWVGQRVTIYDEYENRYVNGEVTDVSLRGEVFVEVEDGSLEHQFDYIAGTNGGSGLAAGQSWNSLTEEQQYEIAENMLSDIEIDSDFDLHIQNSIRNIVNEYASRTKSPVEIKRLGMGIDRISEGAPTAGNWQGDFTGGRINLNQSKFDEWIARHEIGHAYVSLTGYDYTDGARYSPMNAPDWDSINWHKNGGLRWDYDSRGPENWDTSQGDYLPHPTTYMIHDRDSRDGVGIYDDVDDPAFEHWEEWVRETTKYSLQEAEGRDGSTPDYDPFYTERAVFDPDGGRAAPGGALHLISTSDSDYDEYHVKVESSVFRDEDGQHWVTISIHDNERDIPITEDGEIDVDNFEFGGYLPNGADELDPSADPIDYENLPDDPGFYADANDVDEIFREAVNRQLWREMIVTEHGTDSTRPSYYLRYDGYSATNGHETVAHLMEIIFSDDPHSSHASRIENLLENAPELLWAANQKFEFSPEMVTVLENESGLSFDDLMYDIWREHIQ